MLVGAFGLMRQELEISRSRATLRLTSDDACSLARRAVSSNSPS